MSGTGVSIVSIDQPARWAQIVAGIGGPGLAPQYARGLSLSGASPMLVEVRHPDSRMVFCAVEREWEGTVDVVTGYGLTGAWMSDPDPGLFETWRCCAAAQGYVAGYLQLAPGLAEAMPDIEAPAHNEMFVASLGQGAPSTSSRNLRDKIDAALAQGAELRHDQRDLVSALVALYPATMARVGAPAMFSAGTLETWATMPGAMLVGAAIDGQIEAVSLFLVHAGVAEYHLNASTEAGRGLAALLLENAFARLPELGAVTLNLGGGIQRDDGLAVFKRRFGGRRFPLCGVRQVYDGPTFAALCARAGVPQDFGRFPPYRFGPSRAERQGSGP
ncbi:MAG: GNAT family N-acetyltransferase [Thalassobaculum sp.]|uniref:hypothetical protein n=1 Tax=Thalassobaculum sp. TaxID=2022740 RepID=UPI0032EA900E